MPTHKICLTLGKVRWVSMVGTFNSNLNSIVYSFVKYKSFFFTVFYYQCKINMISSVLPVRNMYEFARKLSILCFMISCFHCGTLRTHTRVNPFKFSKSIKIIKKGNKYLNIKIFFLSNWLLHDSFVLKYVYYISFQVETKLLC